MSNPAGPKVVHDYSIEELRDAANLMRGYDLGALHVRRARDMRAARFPSWTLPPRSTSKLPTAESQLGRARPRYLGDRTPAPRPVPGPRLCGLLPVHEGGYPAQAQYPHSRGIRTGSNRGASKPPPIVGPGVEHRGRSGAGRTARSEENTTDSANHHLDNLVAGVPVTAEAHQIGALARRVSGILAGSPKPCGLPVITGAIG